MAATADAGTDADGDAIGHAVPISTVGRRLAATADAGTMPDHYHYREVKMKVKDNVNVVEVAVRHAVEDARYDLALQYRWWSSTCPTPRACDGDAYATDAVYRAAYDAAYAAYIRRYS